MRRMKEVPKENRPREKLSKKGAAALTDSELIEAVIGRGTIRRDVRAIARDIGERIRPGKDLPSYDELSAIDGIGPTRAVQVLACYELGRRYYAGTTGSRKISEPADVLPVVEDMRGQRQEHFVCITLNGAGEIISRRTVTIGLLNHSLVHPREVFADAITDRAASVICVHNHPSGSLDPSPQDIAITGQLREAGATLGIQFLDHIIVTKSGFVSLKEKGFL
jgi:DNA repair protein RadC